MGQGMRGRGMGQGMGPGHMGGRGQMMRPGLIQRLMQRFPFLRRLLGQRRMGGRFGAWW